KNALANLIKNWAAVKDKTATLTNKVKESVKNALSNLKTNWAAVKDKTAILTNIAKEKTKNALANLIKNWAAVKDKTATVTASVKDKASSVFKNIVNSFIDLINKAINKINEKLKISVSKTLSTVLNALGLKVTEGSYQLFSIPTIPKLANGGIVNVPSRGVTLTAGEAGAEAILPLENNTGWMDVLVDKVAAKVVESFSGITLINQMDSRTISREFVKASDRRKFALGGAT
ncbi:MAG: hypothetical protein LUH82_01870, partial [Clostridiales bacterium]|nr:hypothetical protein [Clostridiales bacterium]